MGSVYLGGLGTGFWSDPEQIAFNLKMYEAYEPKMDDATREKYLAFTFTKALLLSYSLERYN